MANEVTLNPICDGWMEHSAHPGFLSWANLIIAAGTDADHTDTWAWAYFYTGNGAGANEWQGLYRSVAIFDLTLYPNITILSARLRVYGLYKGQLPLILPATNVYGGTTVSPTALQASDYATAQSVAFSDAISYASWDDAGWNEWTLNEAGLTYLNDAVGDTVVLFIRNSNYDTAGIAPSWPGDNKSAGIAWAPTPAGAATKPQLILTYIDYSPRQTVAIEDKITLETIRNIEMVARGRFRVGKEGNATYRSRYARNV